MNTTSSKYIIGIVSALMIHTEHTVSITAKRYRNGVGGIVDVKTGEEKTRPTYLKCRSM
jgi:hypothetical protein